MSGVIYLLLKSGVNFKIIYLAYKNNIYVFKKSEFLTIIPVIAAISINFLAIPSMYSPKNAYYEIPLPSFFIFLSLLMIMICMIGILFTLKDSAKEAKSKLIKKEIDNLIKRYELDTSIQL